MDVVDLRHKITVPARIPRRTRRILVLPGGTEIGLEINSALRDCKDIELFSAGTPTSNHAPFVFAQHFELPSVHEPHWIRALNDAVERLSISYIFPAYDDVLVALAENAPQIKAKIVTSPLETCRVTRSKSKTYRLLADVVNVPRLYASANEIDRFPVFVKPDKGQGSQDSYVVNNPEELEVMLRRVVSPLILEYLPGDEYTIDCFSDRDAGLLFCAGRQRTRTRAGISMNSCPATFPEFCEYATAISSRLKFHGAWFFQLRKDSSGDFRLLEIAPRIAGAMAFHRALGVNFAALSIYEQDRVPVRILTNAINVEMDRALVNRYRHPLRYQAVYVDLEDTLILKGKVNIKMASFLYQSLNQNKTIILLTRCASDIGQLLRQYRLHGLFDEIIAVPPRPALKSRYISRRDAIFIDDSFAERSEVALSTGIPTFDCSMVEMLLDDRV